MFYDILENVPEKMIKCLDSGHVRLVDVMPRICPVGQTADYAIVQAARVSYGDGTKSVNEDRGLIRYLMRHVHTTPFEMIEFKFQIKAPIFCARQWVRHRMSSTNEYSGRYSIMKDEFYKPTLDNIRQQSKINKQGGDEKIDDLSASNFLFQIEDMCIKSYQKYEQGLESGISREQARMILPLNLYTEWYWKIDLHNLFHFLALRCDSHAQWEIRVFAEAILELIKPIVPFSVEAWEDYHDHRGAKKLTRLEIDALRSSLSGKTVCGLKSENKREQTEWEEKAKLLGLIVEPLN